MRQLNGSEKGHGITQAIITDDYMAYNVLDNANPIFQFGVYARHEVPEVKYCLLMGEGEGNQSCLVIGEDFEELYRDDSKGFLAGLNVGDLQK